MAEAKNLNDLLYETLKDIYFAERQILAALPKMREAAQSADLKKAFETHAGETQTHVTRLEEVFTLIGRPAQQKTCNAILGIIEEGKEVMTEFKDTDALDAGLIAGAQAVEHYEISRYGTMVAWATRLGLNEVAELLAETLDEEEATDEILTEIAESVANAEAA